MFGVLVIVLCPDRVAGLRFRRARAGLPLLISRAFCEPVGSGRVVLDIHRFERAADDAGGLCWRAPMIGLGPFCMAHSLVVLTNDENQKWLRAFCEGRADVLLKPTACSALPTLAVAIKAPGKKPS